MICYACVCVSVCVCEALHLPANGQKNDFCVCLPACLPACQSCQSPFERVLRVANGKGETSVSRSRDRPVSVQRATPLPLYPAGPATCYPLPSTFYLFPASQSRVTSHQSRTTKHFKCHLVHLTHTHTPLSCECACVCVCVFWLTFAGTMGGEIAQLSPFIMCVCMCVCVNEVTWLLESTTE